MSGADDAREYAEAMATIGQAQQKAFDERDDVQSTRTYIEQTVSELKDVIRDASTNAAKAVQPGSEKQSFDLPAMRTLEDARRAADHCGREYDKIAADLNRALNDFDAADRERPRRTRLILAGSLTVVTPVVIAVLDGTALLAFMCSVVEQ